MSSLDVGLSALSSMFYILFGRRTESFVFYFLSSLEVGLRPFSSMFYILFEHKTERFVFYVLYLV
jgi:hypothetical protein